MYLERGIHSFSVVQLTEAMTTVTLLNVKNIGLTFKMSFLLRTSSENLIWQGGKDETKYHVRDTLSIYYVLSKVMNAVTISII